MGCEVTVAVQKLEKDEEVPEFESLTPVEWRVIQYHRGLNKLDQEWMLRLVSTLVE
ncbi:hypothetical protein [Pseudomonas sp. R5(2019)]|uniref:hypothetical protein n=1 Tax=Pseudomonas sp. R5(2019) TaxID=2697566 RepID=UPI0014125D92|nr:hypothetical protein [Pseudomonas sp. R5(2019)]NBA95647.1 hypothetical protein [Pseudomonas sp. R5(2019)]